ncbi:BTB/POZ domain-containing protein 17 [Plakobranchus ocellatus]|uniref:BTB/POZ domain-containing protein 17 n=1 Tax=Plakobranchus ocellatus TaxID=259542 RepID=A0AAV3ZV36_9GAST|nr:BTB/POZ domain-containing protein 17 [Plakobranchus ocellatus]
MPAASRMKRHSAPTPDSTSASPPPPPSPPPRLPSPIHPSRPPHDDESDATSLTSIGSDGGGGDKRVKAAQSFEALYNSEHLSDFLLDVNQGQYVFHAHKMIVGLKSERLAALITTSTGPGSVSNSNTSSSLSTSVNNNIKSSITMSNTSTFTAGNVGPDKDKQCVGDPSSPTCVKPTLYLQETPECGAVFGRFLYFIYSGAVWLHRDYVLPLHALSVKYGVAALASHCENYIQQLLHKCLQAFDAAAANQGTAPKTAQPVGNLLSAAAVCDVYEAGWDMFGEETRREAFAVLTRRLPELCRSERWAGCAWATVRELLRSDACACDENVMLVAATDWMKRTRLQDKARIQELLSSIRYPRLPRRVLYHLHTTASFRNFPPVQALIDAAIRYHCFRDVPEARDEFTGRQYRARGGRPASRHTVCGGEHACCKANGIDDHTSTTDNTEMTNSNSTNNNNNNNPHDIAQPNEWGCYGDPPDMSRLADDRTSADNQHRTNDPAISRNSPDLVSDSRVQDNPNHTSTQRKHHQHNNHRRPHHQHHHGCRTQHTVRNNRHHNQQQHQQQHQQHHHHTHAPQCRSCYDGHQRHQGSPVAAVQPRVHTPPDGERVEAARQTVASQSHHNMSGSRHLDNSPSADAARHVGSMSSSSERSDLPAQPPPFTRV